MKLRHLALALVLPAALPLAACSGGGGLAPGLTARMDQPGAHLDQAAALQIVNHYRQSVGASALALDPALSAKADALASAYAQSGKSPAKPDDARAILTSAGYTSFAETFSGWRNNASDANTLADRGATRAGFGVSSDQNSAYGVHWVLLLK